MVCILSLNKGFLKAVINNFQYQQKTGTYFNFVTYF